MISAANYRPVDWNSIHSGEYVYEVGCWKTCDGGFCCKHDHPDFDFQFLPKNGSVIMYMEDEYHYFAKRGQVSSTPAQKITLDFGGPRPLVVYHVFCGLLGRCDGVMEKPFLCKIYPFMPILGAQGELESLWHASIFELTFELVKSKTPCTVFNKLESYKKLWTDNPRILDPLRHPYVVFYLQAIKYFSRSYEKTLLARSDLMRKSGKEFWSEWEIAYLRGELFDLDEIKYELSKVYRDLSQTYGDFLAPVHELPVA